MRDCRGRNKSCGARRGQRRRDRIMPFRANQALASCKACNEKPSAPRKRCNEKDVTNFASCKTCNEINVDRPNNFNGLTGEDGGWNPTDSDGRENGLSGGMEIVVRGYAARGRHPVIYPGQRPSRPEEKKDRAGALRAGRHVESVRQVRANPYPAEHPRMYRHGRKPRGASRLEGSRRRPSSSRAGFRGPTRRCPYPSAGEAVEGMPKAPPGDR